MKIHTRENISRGFSAFLFLVPAIVIGASGLYINKSLMWLCFYSILNGVNGILALHFLHISPQVLGAFAVVNNYLDTPLMLLVLLLFCHSKRSRTVLHILAVLIVLYEIGIALALRLQPSSTLFVSGPGLLLVFCTSLYFFVVQLKQTIRFGKGLGRTVIIASFFFVYGSYCIIYIFYYVQQVSQVDDVFLLYHFARLNAIVTKDHVVFKIKFIRFISEYLNAVVITCCTNYRDCFVKIK
jgi:hypothetical protein